MSISKGLEKPDIENLLLIPTVWLILTNLGHCSKSPFEVLVVIHISLIEVSGRSLPKDRCEGQRI